MKRSFSRNRFKLWIAQTYLFFCIFVIMKKVIAILFLGLYLTTTTEIFELLKFPVLLSHFLEHQSDNNQITFVRFLEMHYSSQNNHFKNNHNDTKLPFKNHHCCSSCSSLITFLEPSIHFIFNKNVFTPLYIESNYSNTFDIKSNFQSTIWQPPKICC